jgi:putative SOS response-associated peptidase YedK
MCGRVRLHNDYSEIKIQIGFDADAAPPNMPRSWNVAPTDPMLVCVFDRETRKRTPEKMRWGLIASWAKDMNLGYSTFNARAEGIETKAAFRGAWRFGKRCLVITDGFYEWRRGDKQPFAIARANDKMTVMAGLWDVWKSPSGETIKSCTIITTDANDLLSPLYDRMPVILAEEDWPKWLGEVEASEAELKALLRPYPAEKMKLWPVAKRVGNVRNNGPELVVPVEAD